MIYTLPTPIYKRTNSWICLGIFLANLLRTFHDPSLTLGSVVSGQYIETAVSFLYALFFSCAAQCIFRSFFLFYLLLLGFLFKWFGDAVVSLTFSKRHMRCHLYQIIFPYSQNWEHRTEWLRSPFSFHHIYIFRSPSPGFGNFHSMANLKYHPTTNE